MPIYEYRCPECAHQWSDLVSSFDAKSPECPECGNRKSEKLYSTFASSVASSGGAGSPKPSGGGHGCGPGNCGCGRF